MTNRNEDYLGMIKLALDVWEDKQSVFGSIVAVKESFTKIATLKKAIDEKSVQQSVAIGGKTITKKDMRKKMCELSAQLGSVLTGYAYTAQNEDLKKAVDFPISVYNKKRDEEVAELCKVVHLQTKANIANLAEYGITQAMVDQLDVYINSYTSNSKKNLLDVQKRMEYTKEVRELIAQLRDEVDNKLDKVMTIFQFSHPSDYQLYLSARNSMPKRHAKKSNGEVMEDEAGILSGMVTDKADEMPIQGAIVKLTGTDYKTETDSDGEYLFDSLPAGTYTVEVSILDYVTATLADQKVIAGDETIADFAMQKV